MDVRCERCKTEYEFDDARVTAEGVTVKCTQCGYLFRVRRREEAAPPPAGAPADGERSWMIRKPSGEVLSFRELTTLQKWIVERRVSRDDEISRSGSVWKRLGSIAELASFFEVVENAQAVGQPAPGSPAALAAGQPNFVVPGPFPAAGPAAVPMPITKTAPYNFGGATVPAPYAHPNALANALPAAGPSAPAAAPAPTGGAAAPLPHAASYQPTQPAVPTPSSLPHAASYQPAAQPGAPAPAPSSLPHAASYQPAAQPAGLPAAPAPAPAHLPHAASYQAPAAAPARDGTLGPTQLGAGPAGAAAGEAVGGKFMGDRTLAGVSSGLERAGAGLGPVAPEASEPQFASTGAFRAVGGSEGAAWESGGFRGGGSLRFDDDEDLPGRVRRRRRGSGGTVAAVVAVVLLCGGAGVLAWQQGWLARLVEGGGGAPPKLDAPRAAFARDTNEGLTEAAQQLEAILKASPRSVEALVLAADVQAVHAQYLLDDAEAMAKVKAADRAEDLKRQAATKAARAKQLARQALGLTPQGAAANRVMADALRVSGAAATEVETFLAAARRQAPADPAVLLSTGTLAWREGKLDEARAALEKAVSATNPPLSRALYRLAVVHRAAGKPAESKQVIDRLLAQNPQHVRGRDLQITLADAAPAAQPGQPGGAAGAAPAGGAPAGAGGPAQGAGAGASAATPPAGAVAATPPAPGGSAGAGAGTGAGAGAAKPPAGKGGAGARAPAVAAGGAGARGGRAAARKGAGARGGAEVAAGGGSFRSLIRRADRLAEQGRRAQAVALYERALALKPGSPEALTGIGYAYLDQRRRQLALVKFRQALARSPGYGDALIGVAEAHRALGEQRRALTAYKKYLARHPNGPRARMARKNVQELEDQLGLARKKLAPAVEPIREPEAGSGGPSGPSGAGSSESGPSAGPAPGAGASPSPGAGPSGGGGGSTPPSTAPQRPVGAPPPLPDKPPAPPEEPAGKPAEKPAAKPAPADEPPAPPDPAP